MSGFPDKMKLRQSPTFSLRNKGVVLQPWSLGYGLVTPGKSQPACVSAAMLPNNKLHPYGRIRCYRYTADGSNFQKRFEVHGKGQGDVARHPVLYTSNKVDSKTNGIVFRMIYFPAQRTIIMVKAAVVINRHVQAAAVVNIQSLDIIDGLVFFYQTCEAKSISKRAKDALHGPARFINIPGRYAAGAARTRADGGGVLGLEVGGEQEGEYQSL